MRTNTLFQKYSAKENFNYLSGLVIGTELKDLVGTDAEKIHLLCGGFLENHYQVALKQLGLAGKLQTYPQQWIEETVTRAHCIINNQKQA